MRAEQSCRLRQLGLCTPDPCSARPPGRGSRSASDSLPAAPASSGHREFQHSGQKVACRAFETQLRAILDPEIVDKEAKADQACMAEQYGGFEMLRRREEMAFTPPPTAGAH